MENTHEGPGLRGSARIRGDIVGPTGGLSWEDTGSTRADLHIEHPAISLAGRILFTLLFFGSGITHFTDMAGFVRLMHPSIPFREFWVVVSAIVELAGATMILLDWKPRLGAWLIVLFLLPVTVVVHGVLMLQATDEGMRAIQLSFFLKGLAMAGAALIFTQLGVAKRRS
jgi:putative oxidoreductase